jgi:ABC-type multidrug transport system ATPase subunit
VAALLDEVGLAREADRPVDGFSRGMGQRLALARALLHEPQVLLLDEPFAGLDQQGTARALELLAARRDAGAVLVVVSHDLKSLGPLADRALVLRAGHKVYEGDAGDDLAATYHAHVGRPAA